MATGIVNAASRSLEAAPQPRGAIAAIEGEWLTD
jgi:hypothetical protein